MPISSTTARVREPALTKLWNRHHRPSSQLRRALTEGVHKVDTWTERYRRVTANFPTDPVDPFFNANTPEQLAEAERLLAAHPGL